MDTEHATYPTRWGDGWLETRSYPGVNLTNALAVPLCRGAGGRVALTICFLGSTALGAAETIVAFVGSQLTPLFSVALSLARPSVTVTRDEIGDAIALDWGVYATSGTQGVVASDVIFHPRR